MTALMQYEISCDHPGCGAACPTRFRRAAATRVAAAQLGWVHGISPRRQGPAKMVDLCPEHASHLPVENRVRVSSGRPGEGETT